MLVIALIAGAVVLIPKKGLSAKKTNSIKLPPLPIIPNQVNIPPIASFQKIHQNYQIRQLKMN